MATEVIAKSSTFNIWLLQFSHSLEASEQALRFISLFHSLLLWQHYTTSIHTYVRKCTKVKISLCDISDLLEEYEKRRKHLSDADRETCYDKKDHFSKTKK